MTEKGCPPHREIFKLMESTGNEEFTMERRRFLKAVGKGLLFPPTLGLLSAQAADHRPSQSGQKKRRFLSNHDGTIMLAEPPLTVEHFRQVVKSYAGTPVDTICFCLGDREVYHHDTKVAEVFGRRHGVFDNEWDWRYYHNTHRLIESGTCPLATFVRVCHQEGMDIFASFRMNSHYDIDPDSPQHSAFRLNHPQWLIGHPEGYSQGSKEYGIRRGLNYAVRQVREHMAATITEAFERFSIDGVELDFMRHPAFFKLHEAVENHHHMTDMLRHIKRKRDEVSRTSGRTIELAMRVPPSFEDALRVGLDVRTWIREGLVDILIAGGGFIPFEMPFEEFVEVARGTDCQVFGGLELLRFMEGPTRDPEINRAIAMRYWKGGADGLQLFNYFAQPTEWKQKLFKEIGDPELLSRLDKRYQIDRRRWNPGSGGSHGAAFTCAVPAVQLPVALTETASGGGPALHLQIADNLMSAKKNGALEKIQLQLFFKNCTLQDKIHVRLNGHDLPAVRPAPFNLVSQWNKNQNRFEGQFITGTFQYNVGCPPLRQGKNVIQVQLVQRTPKLSTPLILGMVEAYIKYHEG